MDRDGFSGLRDVVEIADRYINDRVRQLTVHADVRGEVSGVAVTGEQGERLASVGARLADLRARYGARGLEYTDASVEIKPIRSAVRGDQIQLVVAEQGRLTYRQDGGAPQVERYAVERALTFSRTGGAAALAYSMIVVPEGVHPALFRHLDDEDKTVPAMTPTSALEGQPATTVAEAPGPMGRASRGPYDKEKMAAYADKYWGPTGWDWNWAWYLPYPNDCTSFISQCMEAGGWEYEGWGFWERDDPDKWFYSLGPHTDSHTWAAAENWFWYAREHSKRVTHIPWFQDMARGDVLQADFADPEPDGNINHTLIVVRDPGWGMDKGLAGHTNSYHDRALVAILEANPGAIWYGSST